MACVVVEVADGWEVLSCGHAGCSDRNGRVIRERDMQHECCDETLLGKLINKLSKEIKKSYASRRSVGIESSQGSSSSNLSRLKIKNCLIVLTLSTTLLKQKPENCPRKLASYW